MRSLIRLAAFSRPYWLRIVVTTACLIAITALSLAVPRLLQTAIDFGLAQGDAAVIAQIGLALIGIGLARALLNLVQRYNAEWLSHRLAYNARNALYEHIQRLPFAFHDHSQTGQLLARCTEDVGNVQRFVGFALIDLVNVILLFAGILAIMLATDMRLTLIALIPFPILIAYTMRFGIRITPYFNRIDQALARISTVLKETLSGMQVVKAFAREPNRREQFAAGNRELYDSRVTTIRYWGSAFPTMSLMVAVSVALLIGVGGQSVIAGELTLGELVAFNSFILLLSQPVQRLGFIVNMAGEAAATAARAHDFITAFPDGYDTIVGEKGVTLSGGQRQRVAIARALLMNPRILILDDSMSSVDTQTEYAIQQALAELMKGRTTFVIAQRLTTVKRADQILVLDQGRIAQRGAHDDLLREGGLYREIYDLQLRDQEELRRDLAWFEEAPEDGRRKSFAFTSRQEAVT